MKALHCRRLEVHRARGSQRLAHRPGASQVSPHDLVDDEGDVGDVIKVIFYVHLK